MSDEQRMREQFEKWVSGEGYNATRYGDGPFDRYHAVEVNAMWDGYRARDAEVQALREALEHADALMLRAAHTLTKRHGDADAADPLLEAVQQIRNTLREGTSHE